MSCHLLNHCTPKSRNGFTTVEVLIVLVIAGIIILTVFMSLPAMQRNMRNRKREADAAIIKQAVNECLIASQFNPAACNHPDKIGIYESELGIYKGAIWGAENPVPPYGDKIPPTVDEPNWLFGLSCTPNRRWFVEGGYRQQFVVTYRKEVPGENDGYGNFCIDGLP